jgi:PAS domain S-box-containing protein
MNNSLIQLAHYCYWDKEIESLLVDNEHVKLTLSQKKLLSLLVNNLNKPVSSNSIFDEITLKTEKEFNERSVRNLVSGLRKRVFVLNITNIYGGYYMLQKNNTYHDIEFKEYLFEILDQALNAMVITNPNEKDNPIIYVNQAFTELFEYTFEEVIGKNCRFLHQDDTEQLALDEVRKAIIEQKSISVNLRNYTKSNQLLYNEVAISPIYNKKNGKIKYFLGVHKDVTSLQKLMQDFKA